MGKFLYFFLRLLFINSWKTQRAAEKQAEGEAGSLQGARCGTRSQDPGVTPWAEGRHPTAEPPRHPLEPCLFVSPMSPSHGNMQVG